MESCCNSRANHRSLVISNDIDFSCTYYLFNSSFFHLAKPEFGIMSKPADTLLAQINGGDSYSNEQEIICEAINTRPLPDVIFYLGIF